MKHLGIHIDHRLVRHQYQVVMVYLLVIPNIHHKHKDQHLVYHLNLIHNNNNNNNSHHHHYRHRTKTINTTNRIYNPHLQGVNYHLQDQKNIKFHLHNQILQIIHHHHHHHYHNHHIIVQQNLDLNDV